MTKFHTLQRFELKGDKPSFLNFPFNYEPHPWAVVAAEKVMFYLENNSDIEHDFKLAESYEGSVSGKMFGVLVCENLNGEIGYLAGFSGKLGESNHYDYFVPPVFDILDPNGFFIPEMMEINEVNRQIRVLEEDQSLPEKVNAIKREIKELEQKVQNEKERLKHEKIERDFRRKNEILTEEQIEEFNQLSANNNMDFKRLKKDVTAAVLLKKEEINLIQSDVKHLKSERARLSNLLQLKIFQEYKFLNALGEEQDLDQLFTQNLEIQPPAGAGECAAPKLFQFAYLNQLKPLALAEFWWGQSPKSEVKKHGQYYTACKSKCEPILSHMLVGLNVEENPMLVRLKKLSEEIKELPIVYEDEDIVLINKPEGFLSVPGNLYTDSVLTRLQEKYPDATGPLLLHRLDMSTSGILIASKTKKVHYLLQQQFLDHTIQKRYDAILAGHLIDEEGEITLPLRVDLNDRPRQVVCYQHGKDALTKYKVVQEIGSYTHIHFWPITGRTHQLRMHASHESGLNCPILGDDLYGKKSKRLYLHAGYVSFYHPVLQKQVEFEVPAKFELP